MPTYKTSEKCYIGDVVREAGTTFTLEKALPKVPKYLKQMDLTPGQKAAATKAANKAAAEAQASQDAMDAASPTSADDAEATDDESKLDFTGTTGTTDEPTTL